MAICWPMRRRRASIQRQRIDMAPVQAFLTGSARRRCMATDPRSPDGRKVLSAAPLRVDGQLRGYLYIILQGRRLISWRPTPGKNAVETLFCGRCCWWPCLACWQGGWHGSGSLRPVRLLTAQVAADGQDSISAIKTLAARRRSPGLVTRWRCSRTALLTSARQIADQWDRLADSDRQRREFVGQYLSRFAHAADFAAGVSGNADPEGMNG